VRNLQMLIVAPPCPAARMSLSRPEPSIGL
jgi:hypothetical protein